MFILANLPEGRGFAPMQWQILEGKNTIPICLLEVAEKVDEGNVYLRSNIQLDGKELYEELRSKTSGSYFRFDFSISGKISEL